jgi:hypothetical protein
MSALFNTLTNRSQSLKLPKSSETHSKLGFQHLFTTNNRLLDWLLCQNCFDLSSYSNFSKKLQDQFSNYHKEVKESMSQLAEKENEEWDDPLACNTIISFEMETKHQIDVDLERTEYFVQSMTDEESKQFCFKILFRWSFQNKKLGYRQGMNEVLSILMKVVFEFCSKVAEDNKDDVLGKEMDTTQNHSAQKDFIFDEISLEFSESEEAIANIFKDKLFLCGLLFDNLLSNGIEQFYNFETKGVKKTELFLHQTVHKIFKKRLKVNLYSF